MALKHMIFIGLALMGIGLIPVPANLEPVTVKQDTVILAPIQVDTPSPELVAKREKELKCLTENIYHEAPYEGPEGRLAVATVTMNRVKSGDFPKSVCGVVYQRGKRGCQFSWVCGPGIKTRNPVRYEKALTTAKAVLYNNERHEGLRGALFFHNTTVKPSWAYTYTPLKKIGTHIFYSPTRSKR